MEEEPQPAPQPPVDPISRPSSASTSASAAATQLPGIAALAASTVASAAANEAAQQSAPAPRPPPPPPSTQQYNGASPAATTGGNGNNLPTCHNCSTSTTPLWRRDEFGAVLCNACGLFLKLHGRPRPISLKTDVIKSRNRVKTMRTDGPPKKKNAAQAQNPQGARRKSANGNGEVVDSPISRTATPSMYNQSLPFSMEDPYHTTGVGGFGTAGEVGGSPMNGDRGLEGPQTNEQLIAQNASLKTRVSELEFINELFRGRLSQLEQIEADAQRRQEEGSAQPTLSAEDQKQLQAQLEDSHRRENSLKRRLDDIEVELNVLKAARDAREALEQESERPAKKARTEAEQPEAQPVEAKVEAEAEQEPNNLPSAEVPEATAA